MTIRSRQLICQFALAALLSACGGGGSSSQVGTGETSEPIKTTVKRFSDVTDISGLDYVAGYKNEAQLSEVQKFCSGVASGDIDNDGLTDLFIVRGDIDHHLLYRNLGGNKFEEIAIKSGLDFKEVSIGNGLDRNDHQACGATFADIDGDSDLDLFVAGIEGHESLLYQNTFSENGEIGFVDVSEDWGVKNFAANQSISATFGDYNADGWLDMFVAHWGTEERVTKQHLFKNVQGTHFQNVTTETGLADKLIKTPTNNAMLGDGHDYSFLGSFSDVNNDHLVDLLVVGDFGTSQVFLNTGSAQFSPAVDLVLSDENGMGSAVGDYDNDGDLDWFVTGIYNPSSPGNRFYENETISSTASVTVFSDVTSAMAVADGAWGWAACTADFNRDGLLDIFHVTGWDAALFDLDYTATPSRLFMSELDSSGAQIQFSEQAISAGLTQRSQATSTVCFDSDLDGDIDILTVGRADSPVTLYQNNGIDNANYITVLLAGKAPNTQAAGARIHINANSQRQMREVQVGSNFTSQNPTEQVFGVGLDTIIEEVKVAWPDGRITVLSDIASNQRLVIEHPDK